MRTLVCLTCNLPFRGEAVRKFCSRKCYGKYNAPRLLRFGTFSCERCGVPVTIQASLARRYRFCRDCRYLAAAASTAITKGPRPQGACEICGSPFYKPAGGIGRFCSRECYGISRRGIPNLRQRGRPTSYPYKAGYRPDLGHYVRSRWEANYARYLLHVGRTYRYEPGIFVLERADGTRFSYRPDFLVDNVEYVEIKGRWLNRDIERVTLFPLQFPELPLTVIDGQGYRRLTVEFSHVIPGWENQGDPLWPQPERRCPTCGGLVSSLDAKTVFCSRQCSNIRYADPEYRRMRGLRTLEK